MTFPRPSERPNLSRPGGGISRPGGAVPLLENITRSGGGIGINRPGGGIARPESRPEWGNQWGNWGNWNQLNLSNNNVNV